MLRLTAIILALLLSIVGVTPQHSAATTTTAPPLAAQPQQQQQQSSSLTSDAGQPKSGIKSHEKRQIFNPYQPPRKPPNIVIIVADDLGWNDVGFHGSTQIPTPNLDALAYEGVILNNYYVQPLCTPSRASLMTGLYPYHTGMQHHVIRTPEPYGLPLKFQIMPQYFKDLGYTTHAIGKWHLGFFKSKYQPHNRGFDTHLGYMSGFIDYFDHTQQFRNHRGHDFWFNGEHYTNESGRYATDVFTDRAVNVIEGHNKSQPLLMYLCQLATHAANPSDPLQAPQEVIDQFTYINHPNRTVYAAMTSKLDESVGRVVEALHKNGMLDNTIIVFTTDNGAQIEGALPNYGSNWPLRGEKRTLWEGAVRGTGFIWSPLIRYPRRVSNHMMHLVDWLPTLYSAAGGTATDLGPLDGYDMWQTISDGEPQSPRQEIIHNIDPIDNTAAIRSNQYKLISGVVENGTLDHWYPNLGYGGSTSPRYLDELMQQSKAAQVLKAANLWTYDDDDEANDIYTAQRRNPLKYLWRTEASVSCVAPQPLRRHCDLRKDGYCLFDISNDPCEYENIADLRPDVTNRLLYRLRDASRYMEAPKNKPIDEEAWPEKHGGQWVAWRENDNCTDDEENSVPDIPEERPLYVPDRYSPNRELFPRTPANIPGFPYYPPSIPPPPPLTPGYRRNFQDVPQQYPRDLPQNIPRVYNRPDPRTVPGTGYQAPLPGGYSHFALYPGSNQPVYYK